MVDPNANYTISVKFSRACLRIFTLFDFIVLFGIAYWILSKHANHFNFLFVMEHRPTGLAYR